MDKPKSLANEFWGGLAAMLVALPSAIAFGVAIFSPLGAAYVAVGALAGILGTFALGLVAPAFGGTNGLITTPSAPAAAVLAAFAIDLMQKGIAPGKVLLLIALVSLVCGLLQIAFGLVGMGRLIKYMPFPVVSGFSSGVGLIIIIGQVPRFLGVSKETLFWQALGSPWLWQWQGVVVGGVTVLVMLLAPRVTKAVPAVILALASGVLTYFALSFHYPALLELAGNKLVIGQLGMAGGGFFQAMVGRWKAIGGVNPSDLKLLIYPALTLAVLLSIDTLKTSVVLDAITRSRHNSNRELIGQGLGNLASTALGGMLGSGQSGATMVNIASGGQTRLSGLIEGALALVAFLILGRFIAWVPIAALAGILIVVGFRMFDRHSLNLLKSRSTILDFVVIVVVVAVAETVSLIAASGVGIALAIMLFIREQVGGAVVRRKTYGNQMFSKQVRLPEEMELLTQRGDQAVIFELQGSLFFGTTDQLYTALEPELKVRKYVVLDMRRVQSVDFTAAHMLEQIQGMLAERDAFLVFSQLPRAAPSGQDMKRYFLTLGLVSSERHVRGFRELDAALEWVEDQILQAELRDKAAEKPLELHEIEVFKGRKEDTLSELAACVGRRSVKEGEFVFRLGEPGDEMFLIRRGAVRILLPIVGKHSHHLATFGRGDFFGEMTFLDGVPRSADAVAGVDTDLFVLSRERFDALADHHKRLGMNLLEGLAKALAIRLRHTNTELRTLEDS